jgi:hypothetical protein
MADGVAHLVEALGVVVPLLVYGCPGFDEADSDSLGGGPR